MLTRKSGRRTVTLTAEEEAVVRAEWAANAASKAQAAEDATARQAQRDARLAEIPANVNSVPALRDIVNDILKELRGED